MAEEQPIEHISNSVKNTGGAFLAIKPDMILSQQVEECEYLSESWGAVCKVEELNQNADVVPLDHVSRMITCSQLAPQTPTNDI